MTIFELIKTYESNILYDAHSLRLRISRSRAGKEIIKRGKPILRVLAEHLQTKFQARGPIDQDLFRAWIDLVSGITDVPTEIFKSEGFDKQDALRLALACVQGYGPSLKTKEDLRFERVIAAIRNPDFGAYKLRKVLVLYKDLPECTSERLHCIYEMMEKFHSDGSPTTSNAHP